MNDGRTPPPLRDAILIGEVSREDVDAVVATLGRHPFARADAAGRVRLRFEAESVLHVFLEASSTPGDWALSIPLFLDASHMQRSLEFGAAMLDALAGKRLTLLVSAYLCDDGARGDPDRE